MALPLRPYHPQRFIHQKFHPNPTKRLKHLQCEAHRTGSAVQVQHGSSSQAISPAALHPSEASCNSDKKVEASSLRSPPDQIRFISHQNPSCPAPRFARRIEALPSLNCHLAHGLGKVLLWSEKVTHSRGAIATATPPDPLILTKQRLSPACRPAFIIY